MAIVIDDFYRTWVANLPKIGDPRYGIPNLNLMEGSLTGKGMLAAIYSQQNMSRGMQLKEVFTRQDGSKRLAIAKYKYQQRRVQADISTALPVDYCSVGTSPTYIDGEQEIAQTVSYKMTILNDDLLRQAVASQETFASVMNEQFSLAFEAFTGVFEKALITSYNTKRGINLTNGAATPVAAPVFKDAFDSINRAGSRVITDEFWLQEYAGQPIIAVGDRGARAWYSGVVQPNVQMIPNQGYTGGGTDVANDAGQIISRTMPDGLTLYISQQLNSVLDAANTTNIDHLAAWKAGALQVLEAYDFDKFAKDGDIVKQMTMSFVYGGLPIACDVAMNYEYCDSGALGWTITIAKKFDLWAFPKTNAFQATDPLYTSNGTALFSLTTVTP